MRVLSYGRARTYMGPIFTVTTKPTQAYQDNHRFAVHELYAPNCKNYFPPA